MKKHTLFFVVLAILIGLQIQPTFGQKKKKKKDETASVSLKKDETKKIKDLIAKHSVKEGLFTFYQDSTSGETKMLIKTDQIDKEFIHFYYFENGVLEAAAVRGGYLGSKLVKITKYFNRIEWTAINTNFYFDPENALSKSQNANVANSLLYSSEILGGSEEEGGYLIKADPLFINDDLGVIDFTSERKKPTDFKLGSMSKSKSKLQAIKNYQKNSDVIVEYVFENKKPELLDSDAVQDSRNISIVVQHSLIEVPVNDYQPRYDDPRVGYFMTKVNDMTSTEVINYRDVINRWHLVKKDTSLTVSEPIEPITYWMENTTPMEFRETIKEGVLQWNKAFEKAGYKNALVVKQQPDTATWDAGDIRYNVLRWTSSPNPPFGGYGPRFTNPRTGQILGTDIMLEYVYYTYRVLYSKLYESSTQENNDWLFCSASHHMQENLILAASFLKSMDATEQEMEGLKKEAMRELVMHEVGHTLGLNHNMKASYLFSPAQLADKNFIVGKALTGSIMDYLEINLTADKSKQGQFFSPTIGPYDEWAIEYGYHFDGSQENLERILKRSTEPELIFGNDADDMRYPGKGIDPRVMISDLSNNPIGYSIERFKLTDQVMTTIKSKFAIEGQSYEEFYQNFHVLMNAKNTSGVIISRFIGGVYVDRAMVGQEGETQPFTPVSYQDQKRAMNALEKYVFAPNAYEVSADLYNYLAKQRRGFDAYNKNEDPKIHALISKYQSNVLDQLLHKNTLQRIIDSELYGNKYNYPEFMTNLNDAIFKADINGNVNSRRQNLQTDYTKKLIEIIDDKSDYMDAAKSMALYNLQLIRKMVNTNIGNLATQAHRQNLAWIVNQALEK